MTDGTTGIQVAPITEDDMNRVKSILQRAADAIVGASQMANDIAAMRAELDALKADSERLRNQNNALDEALNHSREMRDNQARELASTKDQLSDYQNRYIHLNNDLETVQRQNEELTAKLDSIHVALGLTPQAMQAPTPEPTPMPPVQATSDAPYWRSEPSSAAETVPTPPSSLADPSTSTEWQPGYNWDATRQLYVRSTPF